MIIKTIKEQTDNIKNRVGPKIHLTNNINIILYYNLKCDKRVFFN